MARTDSLTNFLTDVANAIKDKKNDNTLINASEFDVEIRNLSVNNTDIVDEMKTIDMSILGQFPWRPFSEKDYTKEEVKKLQNLINILGE